MFGYREQPMRGFSLYSPLALLALAASLLAAGCSQGPTPTPPPTPTPLPTATSTPNYAGVSLEREIFSADLPISTTAYLTRFLAGEEINVTLIAEDGSQALVGTAAADAAGLASVEIMHDGLSEGRYSILAIGERGGKASTTFLVK